MSELRVNWDGRISGAVPVDADALSALAADVKEAREAAGAAAWAAARAAQNTQFEAMLREAALEVAS